MIEWYWALTLIMGGFMTLVILGVPIVFAFFAINIVGTWSLMGGASGLRQMVNSMYEGISVFTLLPITLFVLMGEILFRSGVASKMIDALDKWIGNLPGRLSLLAVLSGAMTAALSGASIGSTAMLGSTLVPHMRARGYSTEMSVGPILGSGGLAIMIPPSGLAVILAVLANVSVGRMLMAIIVPGLLMAVLYAGWVILRCTLRPDLAPAYDSPPMRFVAKLLLSLKYVIPLSFLVFLVIGVIFLGVATPTEAAALGSAGAMLVGALYGRLSLSVMVAAVASTLRVAIMVLVILAAAQSFSQILAFTGANRNLAATIAGLDLAPILIILLMQGIVLVLGGFISGVPLMMITIPVFMPVVTTLGYDPIWFLVLLLINIEMSQTTPPFGVLLFVMKGVAPPDVTIGAIIRAAVPFLVCDAIAIGAIMAFPQLALWLPSVAF
jgi:tripartite ATP-independent transporter DctM subunit